MNKFLYSRWSHAYIFFAYLFLTYTTSSAAQKPFNKGTAENYVKKFTGNSTENNNAQRYSGHNLGNDSRVKKFYYKDDSIYRLKLSSKFRSHIVFSEKEEIKTISLGESYLFKVAPVGNRLFISVLSNEEDILTNMTVITNKRCYEFELRVEGNDRKKSEDLPYVVRFIYS